MSLQDPIADMLTRVRNAQVVGKEVVTMPATKLKLAIAKVLKQQGYIKDYSVTEGGKPTMGIELKYYNGKPVIEYIERASKPSLRLYKAAKDLPKVQGGLGVAIVSTPKGVMTDKEARALGVGGEILCYVS
ncbi:MAG: 30S ribosomal protein S8 [Gammaproteobacteria bacterium]|nr:30S ribosomal protein S8 [Gammaproteobacteria bacterium]